jgi:hypothetical protein
MSTKIILSLAMGLFLAVTSPGFAQDEQTVEPVYRERLEEPWTRSERKEVRQDNREALDPIEVREERQEHEPAPFFNGGVPKSLPRFHYGGIWPGYGLHRPIYFPSRYYRGKSGLRVRY